MNSPILPTLLALLFLCCGTVDPTVTPSKSAESVIHRDITADTGNNSPSAILKTTELKEYEMQIDWMWVMNESTQTLGCSTQLIKSGEHPIYRGPASPHQCLVNAIQAYNEHDTAMAINWLCVGQCQNIEVQKMLREYRDQAFQYAFEAYGPLVLE